MAKSMGMCYLCRKPYTHQGMARHLKACRTNDRWFDEKGDGSTGRTALRHEYFHIVVEGKVDPEYWLHVAIPKDAPLRALDKFLRDIWLECCGHLSHFLIDGVLYSDVGDFDEGRRSRSLDNLCGDVLTVGKRFAYEYDSGDTTRLSLRVLEAFRFPVAVDSGVYVFARNVQPVIPCVHCGEPARHVCRSCHWDGGWLCDACADKHECGIEALLPAVNSPRVGVCGYTGNLPWPGDLSDEDDEDFEDDEEGYEEDEDAAAAFDEGFDIWNALNRDPFFMERLLRRMNRLTDEANFQSVEEASAFLSNYFDDVDDDDFDADDPVWQAQRLAWDAYVADDDDEARELAHEALELDPDCADAYVILGNLAEYTKAAVKQYRKAVEAGQRAVVRALGVDAFKTEAGHFWGIVITRPYMRALQCLAMALRSDGKASEAIRHMQELIRLNPEDNLDIRYTLINCYLELGLTAEAGRLITQFGDDRSSHWLYSKALWRYQRSGDSESARRALADAFAANLHDPLRMAETIYQVIELNEDPDLDPTMDTYAPGSLEEADVYIFDSFRAWVESGQALIWLTQETVRLKKVHAAPRRTEKIGRNDPCPCGSGKKYKKCCGR